jgi:two-component system nitrate/nitrite response regulator NarL
MRPRIVVADDNPAFLAKLVFVLATEFEVVATAEDGKAALECVRLYEPNVVVLDLEMPGLNAIEVINELAKYPSSPAVVICSIENDPDIVEAARKAGALGYVFKPRITQDLIAAVKSGASGQSFVSPS